MSDQLQTNFLKENVDVLAPFLIELFNWSLGRGVVPTTFKAACITPLLKKSYFDAADLKAFRPISNLSVLSQLLERLVARQLIDYHMASMLLLELQSTYRALHSDGGPQGARWCPSCCRLRWSGCADAVGSNGCVLVHFVPRWPHTVCSLWPGSVRMFE